MKNKDYLKEKAEYLFALSEGETKIKTYNCVTLNKGENQGYLTVTDRRLCFIEVSAGSRDCRKTEIPLEAFGGMDFGFKKTSNIGKISFSIFFLLLCVASLVVSFVVSLPQVWLKYLLWAVAVVFFVVAIIIFSKRLPSTFHLKIFTSYPLNTFVDFSSVTNHEEFVIKPAADSQLMARELGALILDVKKLGASVKEKYLSKSEHKELMQKRHAEEVSNAEKLAAEEARAHKLEEKQRLRRLKEQRKLEKNRQKEQKKKAAEPKKKDENFFDILNK